MDHQAGMAVENMISSKSYDSVIYSASLGGILAALALRNVGMNPLLMNPTGFPGGDIIQTLSCIQNSPDDDSLDLLPTELVQLLLNQFQAVDAKKIFIDPESWKRVLRVLIKDLNIPALFHVTPLSIQDAGDDIEMAYMDRQGSKTIELKRVVDCTVNGDLLFRRTSGKHSSQNHSEGCINLSCTDIAVGTKIPGIHITQLPGRQWIQKAISAQWLDHPGLEFDAELESVSKSIQGVGGQLQMVPMRPLVFSNLQKDPDPRIVNPWSTSIQNSEAILRTEWEMGAYVSSIL